MLFDASPRPGKGVCHLQGLARTSVAVDALQFGQIWFRSVIRVRRTDVLTSWATGKHLPSSPDDHGTGSRQLTMNKLTGDNWF